jgi:hypothetical protein
LRNTTLGSLLPTLFSHDYPLPSIFPSILCNVSDTKLFSNCPLRIWSLRLHSELK